MLLGMSELDPYDRAILSLMQDDARIKSETVAEAVGLSPTAVQRRLKRLRADGVIRAEPLVLDAAKTGRPLTAIVSITLARGGAAAIDDASRQLRAAPEVQQCWYTAGEADFVAVVTARDMADYDAFTRRVLMDNALVLKFSTIFALSPVKSGLSLALD